MVIPPWPLDEDFEPISHRDNPFRREHALDGKFVVMYSGNMSIAHPLDTILQAARQLKHRSDILFLFVGGGLGRRDIERSAADGRCGNVIVLPYQPREALRYSLSAADVHLVAMGDDMVGIVHPSKIYGAMACPGRSCCWGPAAATRENSCGDTESAGGSTTATCPRPAATGRNGRCRSRRVAADGSSHARRPPQPEQGDPPRRAVR